ncbi:MAG: nickel pincer cofactor biosynthesis protein LarB [Nitrospiraceae bacterium]|nr:MAG: nickel pincer cofactor biosynthesis protein LarB [Nitrospiraceae bacterium]
MDNKKILEILDSVKSGKTGIDEAMDRLKHLPYEDLGVARVDHHRELRHGIPEVIFAEGKEQRDIARIAEAMVKKSGKVLITRAAKPVFKDVSAICRRNRLKAVFHEKSGVIMAGGSAEKKGRIAVLCAGTSDMPVAEEAAVTAQFLGSRVDTVTDVGVAGLHRIVHAQKVFREANALIVIAGMEGALPSVVGGMTDKPIIAVPTSVGYGTSFGGLTALFAMLNSCVPGIAVMNIDNGFGAGVLAHKINILRVKQ